MSFKFYPARPGLRKVLREWQELALRCVWEKWEQGVSTREAREYVLERQTERPYEMSFSKPSSGALCGECKEKE